jgi:hypothetical protein
MPPRYIAICRIACRVISTRRSVVAAVLSASVCRICARNFAIPLLIGWFVAPFPPMLFSTPWLIIRSVLASCSAKSSVTPSDFVTALVHSDESVVNPCSISSCELRPKMASELPGFIVRMRCRICCRIQV